MRSSADGVTNAVHRERFEPGTGRDNLRTLQVLFAVPVHGGKASHTGRNQRMRSYTAKPHPSNPKGTPVPVGSYTRHSRSGQVHKMWLQMGDTLEKYSVMPQRNVIEQHQVLVNLSHVANVRNDSQTEFSVQ